MGLSVRQLWRDRLEDAAPADAETMAFAIEDILNAYETSPHRAEDPRDVGTVLEGARGYSPLGTEILRRRGITGVVVVEDARGGRYLVICDRPPQPPPSGVRLSPREIYRWLRRVLSTGHETVEPRVEWRLWLKVSKYYVAPNFRERISYVSDLALEGLSEAYPVPADVDPEDFRLSIGGEKGEVYYRHAAGALTYAHKLQQAMTRRGIVCAPTVGIAGFTDHPDVARAMGDTALEKDLGEKPVPVPNWAELAGVSQTFGYVDHLIRRCEELETRIDDPEIPERRKAALRRQLESGRHDAREAAGRARAIPMQKLAQVLLHLHAEQRKHR